MPTIKLITEIASPKERVFDLSRSIDLHKTSTAHTQEEAIAGVTSGLINLHETVTWRAKHLGVTQKLTTKITEYDAPNYFVDEMASGAFKDFRHEHYFSEEDGICIMTDVFHYTTPLGWFGKLADVLFLKRYMSDFLASRNAIIKEFAETDRWKEVLRN